MRVLVAYTGRRPDEEEKRGWSTLVVRHGAHARDEERRITRAQRQRRFARCRLSLAPSSPRMSSSDDVGGDDTRSRDPRCVVLGWRAAARRDPRVQRRQGRRRRVGGLARGAAASSSSAHLGRLNVREAREVLRLVLHGLGLRVDGVLGALVLVRLGNVPGEREGRARAEEARATKSDDAHACVRSASSSESGGRGLPPRPAARHGEEPATRRRRVWRVGRR